MERMNSRVAGLILLMSLFVSAGCALSGINKGQINIISTAEEVDMGSKLSVEIEKEYRVLRNPRIQAYVDELGQRVVRVSDRQHITYHFKVLDEPDQINAFALPGGYIYVYSGLLKRAESEAELAGVLAHEVGHVCARHATERLTMLYGYQILLGFVLGEDPKRWQELVTNMFGTLGFLKYSRGDEFEADALAINYANGAGYNPDSYLLFMQKLADLESRSSSSLLALLSTHPPSRDRVERIRAHIALLTTRGTEEARQRYRQRVRGL